MAFDAIRLQRVFGSLLRWPRKHVDIDTALWVELIARYPFFQRLSAAEQIRLKSLTARFLATKKFSGAGGLALTDEICLAIAAQGCLPVLNLGLEYYSGWIGIIVYPDQFIVPRPVEDETGVVHHYVDVAAGESWEGGPLIVSWQDARIAGYGYNVIIHEFAHKLDMANGLADGIPPLSHAQSRQGWQQTLMQSYEDFCTRVASAIACEQEDLLPFDAYAAESPEEFFAVMSEVFFEMPLVFQMEYPVLFDEYRIFYRQDPLSKD